MSSSRGTKTPKHLKKSSFENNLSKPEKAIFFTALILWLIWLFNQTTMLAIPQGSKLNTVVHFIILAIFALSCVRHINLDANFCLAFFMGALGLIVKINSDNFAYVDLAVILYAASHFKFREVAKVAFLTCSVMYLFVVISSQIGFIEDYYFSRGDTIRHGLGFLYTTLPTHYFFYLVLDYLYLRNNQLKPLEYLFILLINIVLYISTDSRNVFILVIGIVATSLLLRLLNENKPSLIVYLQRFCAWLLPLALIASFACLVLYEPNNTFWTSLNSSLSNRLAQTAAAFSTYGIKPFGQEIMFSGNGLVSTLDGVVLDKASSLAGDANYVDNSYMRLLIKDGFITFIFMMYLLISGTYRATRENSTLCIVITFITVHSLFDPQLFSLNYNIFLILFWDCAVAVFQKSNLWQKLCKYLPFLKQETSNLLKGDI